MLRRARNRGQVRSAGTCCQLLVDLGALEYGVTTHVSSSLVDFAEDAGEVVAASPKVSTMRIALCGTTAVGLAAFAAIAAASAPFEQPLLREIAVAPDPAQLQATVQALVGFGTRHTLSDTTSPKRGIGAARRWAQSRFEQIARDCGGCLTIVTPSQTVTGTRVPKPAEIVDVVAVQRGSTDPQRVIV